MRKLITTSTSTLEGFSIEKYIDVISTNVVVGTNFFSDLGASITDLFGGHSDTYQAKLQKIYRIGIEKLKTKASNLGANAIVGLKIDFDEISGKGKSMFMISTFGTAVKIRETEKNKRLKTIESDSIISLEILEQEYNKRIILDKFTDRNLPTQDDWQFLLNSPIKEIAPIILELYLELNQKFKSDLKDKERFLIANTSNFFGNLEREEATEILYRNIIDSREDCTNIIKSNKLFSPQKVLDLVKDGEIGIAIDCLPINKNYYSKEDLKLMEEIIELLEKLEDYGRFELVKGVLGKAKEKYICPNGHTNNPEVEYCPNPGCGQNIKGLQKSQVDNIKNFEIKTSSLKRVLTEN
jgi:uncharacterized protein YbjQ (UPF0145 family)